MTSNLLRWTALAGLAALVAFALPAAAEYYEGKPDCPPDMACTLSAPAEGEPKQDNATAPGALGPEDCIECSKAPEGRGPADCEYCRGDAGNGTDAPTYDGNCGGEVCAYDGGQPNGNGTCMDGAEPWEICDRDVQYLSGPGNGTPQPTATAEESAWAGQRAVPAVGILAAVLGVAGVAALLVFRKR